MIDFYKLISEIKANKEKAEIMDKLGEVTTEIVSSDKLGYNFKVFKVNGVEVKKEYIVNELAKGTSENPIFFADGLSVTPNTYYLYNDIRYVYMGDAKTADSWESVAEMMVEF